MHLRGERVTGDGRNVHAKARGYAYAKTEYVSVRTYLSKNRIRVYDIPFVAYAKVQFTQTYVYTLTHLLQCRSI